MVEPERKTRIGGLRPFDEREQVLAGPTTKAARVFGSPGMRSARVRTLAPDCAIRRSAASSEGVRMPSQ